MIIVFRTTLVKASQAVGVHSHNSVGGKSTYILTFLDDRSRKVFVYFLMPKTEVSEYTKNFINLIENQNGDTVRSLSSGKDTESMNRNLDNSLKIIEIVHHVTVPYSPQ